MSNPHEGTPVRIAMWSGPRNISTAMMRAWENRGDCAVSDEPLYAAYLATTGLDHPMREAIIAAGDPDWRSVVRALTGPVPDGKPIWYQKHMAHHLLPDMDRSWVFTLKNVLLIRDPREVVASYLKARATVTPEDIGLPQQTELYDRLCDAGSPPPVIDSREFLMSPETHFRAMCASCGVDYSGRMLHWPAGPRESDGVWAPHWYAQVWQSTGFDAPLDRAPAALPSMGDRVVEACMPHYERLRARRMTVSD